jgi:hypothetical protein
MLLAYFMRGVLASSSSNGELLPVARSRIVFRLTYLRESRQSSQRELCAGCRGRMRHTACVGAGGS